MKKIILFTFLLLATLYTEAQQKDIRTLFINCDAVKIQKNKIEIVQEINNEGKLSFTYEYLEPGRRRKSIYLNLKTTLNFKCGIEDLLKDDKENKTFISYIQELNGPLNYPPSKKDFMVAYTSEVFIQDYSYKVLISDITFAKVKNKKGKSKVGKKKTIESIFQKKQPNCEIINFLDELIVNLIAQHYLEKRSKD